MERRMSVSSVRWQAGVVEILERSAAVTRPEKSAVTLALPLHPALHDVAVITAWAMPLGRGEGSVNGTGCSAGASCGSASVKTRRFSSAVRDFEMRCGAQ